MTKEVFSFTWKIENYSSCYHKNGEYLKSPVFTTQNLNDCRWYLKIFPRGVGPDYEEYISCYLHKEENCCDSIGIAFDIELLNSNGDALVVCHGLIPCFDTRTNWGQHKILKICDLINSLKDCTEDTLTIQCLMTKTKSEEKKLSACVARTRIGVDKFSFDWNVEYSDVPKWSDSKYVTLSEKFPIKCILTLPVNNILVKIVRLWENNTSFLSQYAICQVSLLNVENNGKNTKDFSHLFDTNDEIWEFPAFIDKSQLNIKNKKAVFNLKFEFTISNRTQVKEIEDYTYQTTVLKDERPTLNNDLKDLWVQRKHTDVEIRLKDGVSFAHKYILSARSPVFAAMFEQDMVESQTGIIEIPNTDWDTMEYLLEFIYADSVNGLNHFSALDLLLEANKYQIPGLKEKCISVLVDCLNEDNVCEIISVADMIGHGKLKESAINYVKTNPQILCTLKWQIWIESNIKLGMEILCLISTDVGNLKKISTKCE